MAASRFARYRPTYNLQLITHNKPPCCQSSVVSRQLEHHTEGDATIRLACLIHAASVHPELGSNSTKKEIEQEVLRSGML